MRSVRFGVILLSCLAITLCARAQYLKSSLLKSSVADVEVSTSTAHYTPLFGTGDADSEKILKGVERFGQLSIDPKGKSRSFQYSRNEMVYYVLSGTGMLQYKDSELPISKNDFFYVPIGTMHGFSNPREDTLNIMVIGVTIPADTVVVPAAGLKLASADKVIFQLLPQNGHGPSSRYQLLLGTTSSKRDRLAAAYQVNSLYVIEFDPGGTNIPHRHKNEEEIYFMLQGEGEMVAGESPQGKEMRYPAREGDAFFFSPNTLVGFYSNAEAGKKYARILAVRVKAPK